MRRSSGYHEISLISYREEIEEIMELLQGQNFESRIWRSLGDDKTSSISHREEIEEIKELLSCIETRLENKEIFRRLRNLLNLL